MSMDDAERTIFEASTREFYAEEFRRTREEVLASAAHVAFHEIDGIFEEPLRLEFSEGEVVLRVRPWTVEHMPAPNSSVLARIEDKKGFSAHHRVDTTGIIIDGVALDGVMRPDDRGTIAKSCHIAFRPYAIKKVTYYGLNRDRQIEEFNRIETLRTLGMIRRIHDTDYEMVPSSTVQYFPPLIQARLGNDSRPLFDN